MVCFQDSSTRFSDKLTGALIGLARATDGNGHLITPASTAVVVESLAATLTKEDPDTLTALYRRIEEEKRRMVPDCFACASPCGKNNAYDMENLWNTVAEIRSLKCLLLLGIRGMAVSARRAAVLGRHDEEVDRFFYKALIVIGMDDFGVEELLPIVMEMGNVNLRCMALLDKAGRPTAW